MTEVTFDTIVQDGPLCSYPLTHHAVWVRKWILLGQQMYNEYQGKRGLEFSDPPRIL